MQQVRQKKILNWEENWNIKNDKYTNGERGRKTRERGKQGKGDEEKGELITLKVPVNPVVNRYIKPQENDTVLSKGKFTMPLDASSGN